MINHLHGDPTATMLWEWLPVKPMTFYDHVETLRLIWKNQYWRALVLKDYGVQEWNLVRQGQTMERSLPLNWETALLEHCCRREVFGDNMIEWIDCYNHWVVFLSLFPCDLCKGFFQTHKLSFPLAFLERWVFDSNLHKSSSPLRLYGYAVSSRGAQKFIRLFEDPWLAFSNYDWYLINHTSYVYSTWTEVILNQTFNHQSFRILKTDIQIGKHSHWNGFLADSVMEIIYCVRVCVHMEEGKEIVIWRVTHLSPDGLITRKAIL